MWYTSDICKILYEIYNGSSPIIQIFLTLKLTRINTFYHKILCFFYYLLEKFIFIGYVDYFQPLVL